MGNIVDILRTDPETGEAQHNRYEGDYRVKITSENSINSFRHLRNGLVDIHKGERYIKLYPARIDDILDDDLTFNELKLLLAVMSHAIKFQTGEIVHEDMVPVTADWLSKKAHVDVSRGRAALKLLVERGILAKERRGRGFVYYGNPFIFVCGNAVSPELFDMFKNTKWANLPIPEGLMDGKEVHKV